MEPKYINIAEEGIDELVKTVNKESLIDYVVPVAFWLVSTAIFGIFLYGCLGGK